MSGMYSFFQQKTRKKITAGHEKVLTLQKQVRILKKHFRILILDKF